jgi:hypothetical protein
MNIIFGKDKLEDVDERYVVLELDTFLLPNADQPTTAYCVVDSLDLDEIPMVNHFRELHSNLLKNYRSQNWNFCEQALEHLTPKWRGELASFYQELARRIEQFKQEPPGDGWDGIIDRRGDGTAATNS